MAIIYHQIFCDESGKYQNDPLIAFSGVSASEDRLHSFDREWRALLRSYELDVLHMKHVSRLADSHGYRFHSGQTIDERTELLFPFADCINKHLEMGFIQAWSVPGYNRLTWAAKKALGGGSDDPYFRTFVRGLMEVIEHIDEDDRISIVCDDDINTAWDCYLHYRQLGKAEWKIQRAAVAISFANDKHFPGLQAADMVAFLTKHEAQERFLGQLNIWHRLYDRLVTEPKPQYGVMRWREGYFDDEVLTKLANEMNVLAEEAKYEKQVTRRKKSDSR